MRTDPWLRRTKRQFRRLIIVVCTMLLTGCGALARPLPSVPTVLPGHECVNRGESSLTSSDAGLETPSDGAHAQVAGLAFSGDRESLWVAYTFGSRSSSGRLERFRLPGLAGISSTVLGPLDVKLTRFNRDATMLAAAGPDLTNPASVSIEVRATETGRLVSSRKPALTRLDGVTDLSLSPDGQWVLTGWHGGFEITSSWEEENHRGRGAGLGYHDGERNVMAVSFDTTGRLFAVGTRNEDFVAKRVWGQVDVSTWDGSDFHDLPPILQWKGVSSTQGIGRPFFELERAPLRLAFDPSNHWLAVQTTKTLELRDLRDALLSQRSQVEVPESTWGVVEFSPSDSLLAVGYSGGLRVLGVPVLKAVLDKPGAPTMAIAFSPDGCLLAWGDMEGTVHITSAPQP